ncbi:MAG: hypothetical protein HUJ22_01045 [Gracilimonas sp.]|uniref:hypothetical protein n=1 Tax=Gracilimonas sp. TaxID=1974203 RepID=UPI0019AAA5E0|nr:hypothetical protein [Gracilimonas sp.]MBD3615127.1 hypothetical protein [Gracilimonas sp.]
MYFRILIVIAFSLFLANCSTGPDFERDNINDPLAKNFTPNPPSGLNYQMDNNGNVSLFWEDKTDFELGYRIYKSLGENKTFRLLAELEENSTSYSDTSKIFAFPTHYHIVSYSNEKESDTTTVNIDFGKISNFEAEFSAGYDSVNFSWQSEFFFINVDGFILSKKTDKDSKFKLEKVIPNSVSQYSIPTPQDGFVHEFKLSAFNLYSSDTTSFESNTVPFLSTEPKNLELKLLTPDSLHVTWKSISDFEKSFQLTLIDQTGEETVFLENDVSSHIFAKQFVMNDKVEVSLKARNNSLLSPFVTKSLNTTLDPPTLEQIQHVSINEFTVLISDPSQVRREINIFRKTKNSAFQEIGTVEKGDTIFVDAAVDPTEIYTYYASTALSEDSNPINVYFAKSFEQVKTIIESDELTEVTIEEGRLAYRYDSSKLVFPSSYDRLEATIYDILTENILLKFDLAIFPNKIAFDKNETKIYTTNNENSNIYVYDFETGAIIDSVNLEYSGIYDFKLLNPDKLVATVHTDHTGYELITINLTTHVVESSDSIGPDNPQLVIDKAGENLLLISYQSGLQYSYDHYSITNDAELIFNKRDLNSFYTTNFSPDLDTAIVVGQDDLSLFNVNTGERYWHFEHYSLSNYCCSNVQLLPDEHIILQGQYCTYLIDMKLNHYPIIDKHCPESSRLNAAGLVNLSLENNNLILDLRKSHTSGYYDFIDILTFKEEWKEVFME